MCQSITEFKLDAILVPYIYDGSKVPSRFQKQAKRSNKKPQFRIKTFCYEVKISISNFNLLFPTKCFRIKMSI